MSFSVCVVCVQAIQSMYMYVHVCTSICYVHVVSMHSIHVCMCVCILCNSEVQRCVCMRVHSLISCIESVAMYLPQLTPWFASKHSHLQNSCSPHFTKIVNQIWHNLSPFLQSSCLSVCQLLRLAHSQEHAHQAF